MMNIFQMRFNWITLNKLVKSETVHEFGVATQSRRADPICCKTQDKILCLFRWKCYFRTISKMHDRVSKNPNSRTSRRWPIERGGCVACRGVCYSRMHKGGLDNHPTPYMATKFAQLYRLMSIYSLVKPLKGSNVVGGEISHILLSQAKQKGKATYREKKQKLLEKIT